MKTLFGALVMAAAIPAAALAQTTGMQQSSPAPQASAAAQGGGDVILVPFGKKSPAGSAILDQQGSNLQVTLHLPAGYQSSGKAAIYSGSCKASGASATTSGQSYTLNVSNTSGGDLTTLQGVTLQQLTSSPHVIVVHGTPSLCGDVTNLLPPQKP